MIKRILFGTIGAAALAAPALAQEIQWERNPTLSVGESMTIAAARAKCGGTNIPNWSSVQKRLPSTDLGEFSDGGTGVVLSRKCDGRTPARAIVFTAEKTGRETVEIYSTEINITVR